MDPLCLEDATDEFRDKAEAIATRLLQQEWPRAGMDYAQSVWIALAKYANERFGDNTDLPTPHGFVETFVNQFNTGFTFLAICQLYARAVALLREREFRPLLAMGVIHIQEGPVSTEWLDHPENYEPNFKTPSVRSKIKVVKRMIHARGLGILRLRSDFVRPSSYPNHTLVLQLRRSDGSSAKLRVPNACVNYALLLLVTSCQPFLYLFGYLGEFTPRVDIESIQIMNSQVVERLATYR